MASGRRCTLNKWALVLVVLLSSGCSANLTRRQPFSAYIEEALPLRRPVLICRVREDLAPYMMKFDRTTPGQYLMTDTDNAIKDFYQEGISVMSPCAQLRPAPRSPCGASIPIAGAADLIYRLTAN